MTSRSRITRGIESITVGQMSCAMTKSGRRHIISIIAVYVICMRTASISLKSLFWEVNCLGFRLRIVGEMSPSIIAPDTGQYWLCSASTRRVLRDRNDVCYSCPPWNGLNLQPISQVMRAFRQSISDSQLLSHRTASAAEIFGGWLVEYVMYCDL